MLDELGFVAETARARLRAARGLAASGRYTEAESQLRLALGFYRSVGAERYIREAETCFRPRASVSSSNAAGPALQRTRLQHVDDG
jgi:hypothetical protein